MVHLKGVGDIVQVYGGFNNISTQAGVLLLRLKMEKF